MNLHTHRHHDSNDARDRMRGGLRELVSGVEDLLRSTASYSGAEIESTRDRLKRQLDAAREQAESWERSAVGRYRQASAATDDYVHDNAWKTAGVAIVLGIAIGACLMSDHWRR
ncbi:DUF883 family protein [Bordetella petrii]|uniref:DUF883 family protein n=1 Tax=Bordetella petrii TaxID=94624 RepID=UPI001E389B40|nr:DUF883 domain-containing protein [Bordetella petrii]MCD0504437.1 DUF883 domain-containing protein [Bordetella petrii]